MTLTQAEGLRLLGKYIVKQGLRSATDRRQIHCDAALAEIVGKGSFTIFEAKQLIERHLTPIHDARRSDTSGAASARTGSGGSGSEEGSEEESEEEGEEEEEDDEEGQDGGDGLVHEDGGRASTVGEGAAATSRDEADDGERAIAESQPAIKTEGGGGTKRKRKQHAERWTPPTEYLCPITQELMRDWQI